MNWIKQLLSRRRLYSDLSAEIQEHLEEKVDELVARGMSREDATHAARREFGNVTLLEERSREVWQWQSLESFLTDVRYGLRQLRRNPGFTAVAVLTLALGIGANTAMFTVIDSVLLRPLPFRNADRLVSIKAMWGSSETGVSWLDYQDIRTRSRLLEDVMGTGGDPSVMETPKGGQKVDRVTITSNFLDMLGVHPALGRPFDSKDYEYGAAPVVLLSAELWRGRFGADPLILGRQVRIGGVPHAVVGIMPDGFHFQQIDADITSRVWLPMRNGGSEPARALPI